ncbi:uncharacterized protein MELLADRAFT_68204 [Melampsora larici-populina 98AG31]|uniref:Uncharacterized protein n=1 Tax=Melampsora larici-populina (strain 98AG31 / pathotype 3-4-7) TaxID=747676 RepID=F4S5Y5_MELLP|nr:uncharacterized protein MELLADRAFT_68204 [Melampsora larici-populina 98AG31]EGF99987.1 hypothetical protein MELLADRAFT_68204 [Melampsora larici-populina 98AG31]
MIEETARPNPSNIDPPHILQAPECVHVQETSVSSRSIIDLSSMPVEIKELIVDWVRRLSESTDDSAAVRSLALVNRLFYEICCRHLFKASFSVVKDVINLKVEPVKHLLRELPNFQTHSKHLRLFVWRVSYAELLEDDMFIEGQPDTWNEDTRSQWDSKARSELFLSILHTCPRIDGLNIDLDPFECITEDSSSDKEVSMWCYDKNMMNKFIGPITQLSSLVDLELMSPLGVLHAFTKLFTSTLKEFRLNAVAQHADLNTDLISQAILAGKLVFELPKLNALQVSNCLDMQLLKSFEASKNLSEIDLYETPMSLQSDVTTLLQLWPKLKELTIWHSTAFKSAPDVDRLMQLADKKGIKMRLESNLNDYYYDKLTW